MKFKKIETLLSVLFIIVFGGYAVNLISKILRSYPEARAEMRHFVNRVPLNITRNQFNTIFKNGQYQHLELRPIQNLELFSVRTPIEFGAKNWLLYVEFDRDKLVALRMRTPDDMRFRPRDDAPADKVAASWKKRFPDH